MFSLSLLKSGCAIAAVARAHSEEDPHPDIGQGTHGNRVAFSLLSLALVVVSGPACSLSALPCKLLQRIAQRFATGIAPMRLGIVATLKQDGRGSSQGLQTRRISIAVRIIPNFSRSDSDGIGNQLWLVQGLEDLWSNLGGSRMTSLLEDLSNLSNRSSHRLLWGGVGLQKGQSATLLH